MATLTLFLAGCDIDLVVSGSVVGWIGVSGM